MQSSFQGTQTDLSAHRPRRRLPERQIPAACEACRIRKSKCDGGRPCSNCRGRGTECHFLTHEGETHPQAAKRRHEELGESQRALDELVKSLVASDDHHALVALHRLKAGEDVGAVLKWLRQDETPSLTNSDLGQTIRAMFAQSTATLPQILSLSSDMMTHGDLRNLHASLDTLRNRVVDAGMLKRCMATSRSTQQYNSSESQSPPQDQLDALPDDPKFVVPVEPWVDLTTDVQFLSRLISVFLNHINPYWRYLEDELFLTDMLSGVPGQFCSAFLVNAICAFACLHCEYDETFEEDSEYATRGRKFHNEALRLWQCEMGRASLTNLQALAILAMDSGYRARDKQSCTLISEAIRLSAQLPMKDDDDRKYTQARISIAWAIHHMDVTCSTALLMHCHPMDGELEVPPNFGEQYDHWDRRPFSRKKASLRRNALFRETCSLIRIGADINELLFSRNAPEERSAYLRTVEGLAGKLSTWHDNLPPDFQYRKDLPAPLYELHAEYHNTLMILCTSVESPKTRSLGNAFQSPTRGESPEGSPTEPAALTLLDTRDLHTLQVVNLLRDYREVYSLKPILPTIFQAQATSSFFLLIRLKNATGQASPVFLQQQRHSVYDDVAAAFEESFRGLLGASTEIMMARGVLRMLIQTVAHLNISPPEAVSAAIQTMHSWHSKEVGQINSAFPNYALAPEATTRSDLEMDSLLKESESAGTISTYSSTSSAE